MNPRNIFLLALVVLLTACVKTQPVLFPDKVNKEEEIENRVKIAIAYLQADEPEKAMSQLKLARDINEKSPRVNEVLALTLERMGENEKARKHFEDMLRYDSSYTRGRANFGSFLMHIEDYEEAFDQFEIVVEDIYYSKRALAFYQLAEAAKKIDEFEKMRAAYQKAVDIDSNFAPALLELAVISFDNEEYAEASKFLAQYREKIDQSSARGLFYGIKLARIFKDKNAEASYALALKNLYPRSEEYLEYIKTIR